MQMVLRLLFLGLLGGPAVSAQAVKGLAGDMAMGNLHNELEQRRQADKSPGDTAPYFSAPAKSLAALMVLNWMVANQEEAFPSDEIMARFAEQASASVDASDELKGRNTRRRFVNLLDDLFTELHGEWQATSGSPEAAQALSDRMWREFQATYGVDLRSMDVERLLEQ